VSVFALIQASGVEGLPLDLVDKICHASFGRPLSRSFDLVFRLAKVNNAPIFVWWKMSEISWTRDDPLCPMDYRV
jgi:hypothetical protein